MIWYQGYGDGLQESLYRYFIRPKDREEITGILEDWFNTCFTELTEKLKKVSNE
jgi:hypothetical protein